MKYKYVDATSSAGDVAVKRILYRLEFKTILLSRMPRLVSDQRVECSHFYILWEMVNWLNFKNEFEQYNGLPLAGDETAAPVGLRMDGNT